MATKYFLRNLVVLLGLFFMLVASTFAIRNTPCGRLCPNAIFVFGDSLSDTGNLYYSNPLNPLTNISNPYGMTYFGHPANRYCDGRLVIDFLTQKLFGYKTFLNPIQLEIVPGTDYKYGVNFAYSGSTAQNDSTITPYHLQKQVDQFLDFKNRTNFESYSQIYQSFTKQYKESLYIIQTGGNDLFYGYRQGLNPSQVIKSIIPNSINAILSTTKRLYNNGARQFIIFNIPAQGCTPITLSTMGESNVEKDDYGCLKDFNNVVQEFNMQLKDGVENLQKELKSANIIYGDNYNLHYDVIKHPTSYGFSKETILQASCGIGGAYNFNPIVTCSFEGEVPSVGFVNLDKSPNDPTQYIYWDGIHFTEAYYKIVSEAILNGKYLNPSVKLRESC